ncbi:MAG: hypothetical protein CMJ75_13240 [Planctomycetaceae bacterium]|nr:hypothetical protein [Planctomycetaceae bacterium]
MKRFTLFLLILVLPGCGSVDDFATGGGLELLAIVLGTFAIFIWKMRRASRGEQSALVTGMLWRVFIFVAAIIIVVIGFLLPDSWL